MKHWDCSFICKGGGGGDEAGGCPVKLCKKAKASSLHTRNAHRGLVPDREGVSIRLLLLLLWVK